MDIIDRYLSFDLPKGQSAFLWGPRKTGKTTFLKQKFPDSLVFDFLKTDLLLDFTARPSLLREQILSQPERILEYPVILDEVQKVPRILDEVHWLIENKGVQFILCGSSTRKLKKGHANLLGGRAWRFELFPLTYAETGAPDLLQCLNHGMIPSHYLQKEPRRSLKGYVQDYLKEEIFDQALTRNVPAFSRFFESISYSHGQLVNYSNIARECGIDSKTVKEYYQILADTLVGAMIHPFKRNQGRQVITKAPRFYLFDVGVAGYLTGRILRDARGEEFGRAFEHFILMELLANRSYSEMDYSIDFWRTKTGLEVDFVLQKGECAIEVKGAARIDSRELKGLKAFHDEYKPRRSIVVCLEKQRRKIDNIEIIPWKIFLDELWEGNLFG